MTAAAPHFPDAAQLVAQNARFAPVELRADVSNLPPNERRALAQLVLAARELDTLFLRQTWSGNEALLLSLAQDRSPLGRARLDAFILHKGPWSRLDENAAFIPGVPSKPPGGDFYPPDTTKPELERWLHTLPEAERRLATGFFTVIRRTPAGAFTAVPYSVAYQGVLARVGDHLRRAAALTAQPTLRRFLTLRAQALSTNAYAESDVAWMELDASIEPTIGPYEVYEDEWFNAKAAFEAFITLRAEKETQKLQRLSAHLQEIEDALPLDAAHRNPKLPALAPIRVVDSIFSSGDANRGVQTAAFNLPNDEEVVAKHGAKRVMLRNVQEAKFRTVLVPLAEKTLVESDVRRLSFDAFFTAILMHELVHGLGPHTLRRDGRDTTVREQLQDVYSAIEEAKADIGGLFALRLLLSRGVLDRSLEAGLDATFVASLLRSLRFGLTEAHAKGCALQLNWLLDAGALRFASSGKLEVVEARMPEAVTGLTRELLRLQAAGDRAGASALLDRMARLRPEVDKLVRAAAAVPVDIAPSFVTAEALIAEER